MRLLLGGLLLVTACSRDGAAPVAPASTPAVAPLLVTTSVSPSTFRGGDAVTVVVTVVNRGDQPVTIELNQCGRAFVVTTPSGDVVGPDPLPCLTYTHSHSLVPGEQYSWTNSWSGRGSVPADTPTLVPGTYLVEGAESIPLSFATEAQTMAVIGTPVEVTP